VWSVAGMVALIFTIKGIASYTQVVFLARAGNSIVAHQQRKIYDRILGQGVAYFRGQVSSDLLMKVTYSANSARAVLETLVTGFIRDLLTAVGLAAVMVYQQPTLSLIALVFGPLALLGVREILKRVRRVMNQDLQSLAEIINVVQETSNGIRVIKAFALEGWMAQRMETAVAQVEARSNSLARLEAATNPLVETLSGFAIASPKHVPGQRDAPAPLQPRQSLDQPRPFRHQKLIRIKVTHPPPPPAEIPRGMGIGQNLIVNLHPAMAKLLIPRHHRQPVPQKPQPLNRAIGAAIVVNVKMPDPRQHMKPRPFRDMLRLIPHDQHQGQTAAPRLGRRRVNRDSGNALPAFQKSKHDVPIAAAPRPQNPL
jgi:hypothetical protein